MFRFINNLFTRTSSNNVKRSVSSCSQRDSDQKNAEDVLFDMFRNESTNCLPIGKFLAVNLVVLMQYLQFKKILLKTPGP